MRAVQEGAVGWRLLGWRRLRMQLTRNASRGGSSSPAYSLCSGPREPTTDPPPEILRSGTGYYGAPS